MSYNQIETIKKNYRGVNFVNTDNYQNKNEIDIVKNLRNGTNLPNINKNFTSNRQSNEKSLSVLIKPPTKLKTLKEIIKI